MPRRSENAVLYLVSPATEAAVSVEGSSLVDGRWFGCDDEGWNAPARSRFAVDWCLEGIEERWRSPAFS